MKRGFLKKKVTCISKTAIYLFIKIEEYICRKSNHQDYSTLTHPCRLLGNSAKQGSFSVAAAVVVVATAAAVVVEVDRAAEVAAAAVVVGQYWAEAYRTWLVDKKWRYRLPVFYWLIIS